jgi:hypothetical protein
LDDFLQEQKWLGARSRSNAAFEFTHPLEYGKQKFNF